MRSRGCGMQERQWITARRSELDALAEQLTKQLQEVQVERDELAIAERVLNRLAGQVQADVEAAAPVSARVAGRAVLLIPHRSDATYEAALPGDYRRILAIVRAADGPVQVRAVGEELGREVAVRGKLEPLRAKMTKLADRGQRHKRPDGRFTTRLTDYTTRWDTTGCRQSRPIPTSTHEQETLAPSRPPHRPETQHTLCLGRPGRSAGGGLLLRRPWQRPIRAYEGAAEQRRLAGRYSGASRFMCTVAPGVFLQDLVQFTGGRGGLGGMVRAGF